MPLIRYRTGDLACVIPAPCACGSSLRRMGKIRGRVAGGVNLGSSGRLNIAALDEILLAVPGVLDYRAEIDQADGKRPLRLQITVHSDPVLKKAASNARRALEEMPEIRRALMNGYLVLDPICLSAESWPSMGAVKRTFIRLRSKADDP